jgi:hypothetical protein
MCRLPLLWAGFSYATHASADIIEENQVDGKTLCDLSDVDLYSNVEDGGLGLKPLQMKRIR